MERLKAVTLLGDVYHMDDLDAINRAFHARTNVPISLCTIVNDDTQSLVSNIGLEEVKSTPRSVSFCSHTIDDVQYCLCVCSI